MKYFIDLFSPETAGAFERSQRNISGFRASRKTYSENQQIGPGDKFICYVTRVQRFIGILEVKSKFFISEAPIFQEEKDPFILRFNVEPLVWLPLEKAIPVHADFVWKSLSFTKNLDQGSNRWTYMVFSSPRLWPTEDCAFLEKILREQAQKLADYPYSQEDQKKLKVQRIKIGSKKEISVSVPGDEGNEQTVQGQEAVKNQRESIKIQGKLAEIGEKLGLKIWLPRSDREAVLKIWTPKEDSLLDELPLVFEDATLKTIQNIDVLWISRRTIVRAFEVEGTTSIYSGILRMADLLAINPNLKVKIHIVAPEDRRNEVFKQISRPVFSSKYFLK